jgi:hypothetical protein
MSNIALFSESGLVPFEGKGGNMTQLTTEAALFKGGKALAALKDLALDVALSKATAGRFRAAAEILEVAFPSQHKAFTKLFNATPWANKTEMASYINAMERAAPGKSGEWNKKQIGARALMAAMRQLPAFRREVEAVDVVATVEEVATAE